MKRRDVGIISALAIFLALPSIVVGSSGTPRDAAAAANWATRQPLETSKILRT